MRPLEGTGDDGRRVAAAQRAHAHAAATEMIQSKQRERDVYCGNCVRSKLCCAGAPTIHGAIGITVRQVEVEVRQRAVYVGPMKRASGCERR